MRAEDGVSVGDEIAAMVTEVGQQGRVNLSRRAALSGEMPSAAELENERGGRGPSRGGMGGRGGGGYGGGRPREDKPPRRGDKDRGGGDGGGGLGGCGGETGGRVGGLSAPVTGWDRGGV